MLRMSQCVPRHCERGTSVAIANFVNIDERVCDRLAIARDEAGLCIAYPFINFSS